MSLLFLKPQYYRPVGVAALVVGVILALYSYFSAVPRSWADFLGGLLIGISIALLVTSFSE
jgi:ABC-type enterobactin transport system permease subunit